MRWKCLWKALLTLLTLLFAFHGRLVEAQFAQPPAALIQRPVDKTAAYESLFRMMGRLEAKAEELEGERITPAGLRGAIGERIGLSAGDLASFLRVARQTEAALRPLDSAATAIIANAKGRYARPGDRPKELVPRPPEELLALQKQRQTVARDAIARLEREISSEGRTRIAEYLKSLLGSYQVLRGN